MSNVHFFPFSACRMMFLLVLCTTDHPSALLDGSDNDEKPLKGTSLCSRDDPVGDSVSRDSLVGYADGEEEFNEDGSFIGEYSGPKYRGSISEPNGPSPISA